MTTSRTIVTAVIVNYRTPDLTLRCLRALAGEREALPLLDVIVVDGGSGDGSADRLAPTLGDHASWTTFVPLPLNGGFGWANNQAIRRALTRSAPPEFIFLINPDAEIEPGALVRLVETLLAHPEAGAAGSQLIALDGRSVGSAFRFPTIRREFLRGANTPLLERLTRTPPLMVEGDRDIATDWVTGASVLFRAEALRQCGLFDEGFFLYFEEVELMYRLAQAGYGARFVPGSRVRHVGGAATGVVDGLTAQPRLPDYWFRSRRRFFTRAYGPVAARMSGLAWTAGFAIWRLREMLGLGRMSAHAANESADLKRNGIAPVPLDRQAAIGRWDDPLDQPPAWMAEA